MRKIFTTLFALAALAVHAQYIPNGSFDSWKGSGSAGSTYQSSNGNEMRKRPGDEPTSWNGSSINQKVKVLFNVTKEETLIYKSTGRNGSAVKMENKYVGAAGVGSNAPGFISFATPWVYAVSTVSNCDGGMYGGISFSHKPDAIKGWYKRTGGTGEKAHIIVYLWKGTFKNNITSSKSNDTKDDTDRAVMGQVASSGDGVRIASCDYTFTTTTNNDWQEIVVPLNYENDYIPEKLNVILSSGDYWTRGNVKKNSVLEADDVEFVYYSELASLTYNGKNYFQQSKTSYTIDEFYDESKLAVTSNGKGATIEKSFNSSTNVLTIKVKGDDYDANNSNVHTYTVNFKTEEPLTIVGVTPTAAVESLKTITVEFSDEIAGTYNESAASKIYLGSSNNAASFTVSGKVLTITLDKAITTPGEYALTIPSGLITRKSNGKAVTSSGEYKFTVKAAPLAVVSVSPNTTVESLKTITVEYSDEISGAYSSSATSKIYVGSSSNTASFSVSGKVLTITLDKAIAKTGEYALYIPAGLVTRKINGDAVTCNGEIKFNVEVAPLEVVSVTPSDEVESLQEITVEYSDEIAGTYSSADASKIYVGLNSNTASFSVSGKVLTITLDKAITVTGEYALYIPSGIITRKINGDAVTCGGEIKFKVKGAPVSETPLAIVAVTPSGEVESLQTVTLEFNDEISGTYSASATSKIYVGSSSNTASFSVSGKVLTITLDKAIVKTGEYALYIPAGLITRKSNGDAVTCDGEVKFKVKVTPLEVVSVTPSGEVESLKTITIEYSDEISGTYSSSATSKIYVGSSSNTASFSVSGKVLTITLDKAIAKTGEYALYIPAGLVTRKINGDAVICNGEIKFNVKIAPLEVVSVTPSDEVESLREITVEYSDEIAGTYSSSATSKIYVGSSSNTASFSVSGKVLTITLDNAIVTPGEYALYIPAGLITRRLNGDAVICDGEIKVKVKEPEVMIDYTPAYTGTKTKSGRWINSVSLSSATYGGEVSNTFTVDNSGKLCYNDYTSTVVMKAAPGEVVTLEINQDDETSWMNSYVYIDADKNGFTASIADGSNWQPAGDLVSYSFYNNNDPYDTNGWNSDGAVINGNNRSTVSMPAFAVPAKAGVYRVRVKLDWCNIDPNGDSDGKFGDFMDNGGQIVDFKLNVCGNSVVEPEPNPTPNPDVDYTPTNTGIRDYSERNINAVRFVSEAYGEKVYDLTASERSNEYLDLTDTFVFTVALGEQASVEIVTEGSWVNHYVYVDYDANGFAASIEGGSNWKPAGDMVAYSFYNNGGSSDASGWNSLGQTITGDGRSFPALPGFTVTSRSGLYRMRIKQDWCSIDPAGDSDSNFGGTFSDYGGQIIDVLLNVVDPTGIEDVEAEEAAVDIYDMQGRKLEQITKPGLYIIGGKKVLVK